MKEKKIHQETLMGGFDCPKLTTNLDWLTAGTCKNKFLFESGH